jgi:alpha-tubulin suppressor-like RCC1 family protein
MRKCVLLVLPCLIAGSNLAVAAPATAYTPSVKPVSKTIGVSDSDSVFIGADGKVYGVGGNPNGEITGTAPRTTPTPLTGLPAGVRATAISVSNLDTLVLGSDGRAYGAGYNADSELTGASAAKVTTLRPLAGLPSGVTATAVSSGFHFSLVLGSNGKVYGAGENDTGQLTGTTNPKSTLAPLTGLPGGVRASAISAGLLHTLVLGTDQHVYGAGDNTYGQLTGASASDGTLTVFDGLPFGAQVTHIEAGSINSVLLTSGERAYVVGGNTNGQLGLGTADTSAHPAPVRIPIDHVVATSAGTANVAVIDADGYVYAAGRNGFGQLARATGDRTIFDYMAVKTGTPSTAPGVEVSLGQNDALVRDADGIVLGAGDNGSGQLPGSANPQTALAVLHGQKVICYVKPTIGGTRQVGHQLTAHAGSWSVKATHYSYQWRRNGVSISGATGSTYNLISTDKGKHISVKVTGSRSGGFTSGSAISASTVAIAPA